MSQQQVANDDVADVIVSKPKYIYGVIVLYCLFMLDFAARLGVLAVFPSMQKELGFTDAELGLIGSAVLLSMGLFVLPLSYLADKTSKKRAITVMSLLWGVGCTLCGFVTNLFLILGGRFLVGIGNSSYAPVSVSLLTSWTKKSRWGSAIGIYNSSMAVGLALGTSASGLLAGLYGWRVSFMVIGGLTLVFAVLSMFLPNGTEKQGASPKKSNLKEAFGVTLKNKTLVLMGIGAGLSNLVFASMMAWIPMYLVRTLGWSSAEAGAALGPVYLIGGICIMPVSGLISDRLARIDNRTRAWFGMPIFLLSATLFIIAFSYGWFIPIVLGILLVYFPLSAKNISTQSFVPSRYRASAYGTYVTFLQGIGFFGPVIAGGLSQAFGLNDALVYMQGILFLAALCMLIAGFTYRSDLAKAKMMDSL
mgnify:FL=1